MKTANYPILLLFIFIVYGCNSQSEKKTENNPSMQKENPIPDKKETTDTLQSKYLYGIDISKYQGNEVANINFNNDSLSFVICKATEGITYTDPDFENNWNEIKVKGVIRGCYHFYRSNDDPTAQANNYLNALKTLQPNDLPPMVDFEETSIVGSPTIADIQNTFLQFIQIIEEKTARKVVVYTDDNIGNRYLNSSDFSNYALWIANYTNREEPTLPAAWEDTGWSFWQKSANYEIGNTANDFDLFNGNMNELTQFIKTH